MAPEHLPDHVVEALNTLSEFIDGVDDPDDLYGLDGQLEALQEKLTEALDG